MNYLRTTRDDKETFEFLAWILIIATACYIAADMELFADRHSMSIRIKIIKFLTEDIPIFIWTVIISITRISFLVMLRKGLPRDGKQIAGLIRTLIIIESATGITQVGGYMFPEFEDIESVLIILFLLDTILYANLGYKLRKNYNGKIKKLGTIFLTCSLIIIILILLLSEISELYSEIEEDYVYDDTDELIEGLAGIFIYVFLSSIQTYPWWYECKLLIEGIDHDDIEEEDEHEVNKDENEEVKKELNKRKLSDVKTIKIKDKIYVNKISKIFRANRKIIISVMVCLFFIGGITIAVRSCGISGRSVPTDREVVTGDFDGDGKDESLWFDDGKFDEEGYTLEPFILRSNNPKFDGLQIEAPFEVHLECLSGLGLIGEDLLGVNPITPSNWQSYSVYRFDNRNWIEAVEPFSINSDGEEERVLKSDEPGCVVIVEDKWNEYYGFTKHRRTVKLN